MCHIVKPKLITLSLHSNHSNTRQGGAWRGAVGFCKARQSAAGRGKVRRGMAGLGEVRFSSGAR